MTFEEAKALKSFKNFCNCGGYAAGTMNGRDPANPHMAWCAQAAEYQEWWDALHQKEETT